MPSTSLASREDIYRDTDVAAKPPPMMAAEGDQYLLARGWRRVDPSASPGPGERWRDPTAGGPPVRKKIGVLPLEGKQRKELWQWFSPSAVWYYAQCEAVEIQAARDEKR